MRDVKLGGGLWSRRGNRSVSGKRSKGNRELSAGTHRLPFRTTHGKRLRRDQFASTGRAFRSRNLYAYEAHTEGPLSVVVGKEHRHRAEGESTTDFSALLQYARRNRYPHESVARVGLIVRDNADIDL